MRRARRRQRSAERRRERQHEELVPEISPETRRAIAIVLLFALGVIGVLAFLGIAGNAGTAIANALRALFGLAAFLVPVVLLVLALLFTRPVGEQKQPDGTTRMGRPPFSVLQLLGLLLLALSLTGLLHLSGAGADAVPRFARDAGFAGGGYLGLAAATPLARLFGTLASGVILTCLSIIGIFLGFHLSFRQIAAAWRTLTGAVASAQLAVRTARYHRQQEATAEEPTFSTRTLTPGDQQPLPPPVSEPEVETSAAAPGGSFDIRHSSFVIPRARRKRARVDLPLDLLSDEVGKPTSGDVRAQQEIIRKTLEHFKIAVEMGEVRVGPTVTQFTLRPAEGVKLSRITGLSSDLALALAAHPIRIEAPIPGRALVGIEVPNQKVAIVRLREVFESDGFKKRSSNLMIALGKDVAGAVWTADVDRMPHLLVAGATGSGKSVLLNAIIVSLLYQNGPDDLRLLLVDPKRVEFPIYNGIPHLLTPVVTDVKKTVHALKWALHEMDRRFELLASAQKRDLTTYNAARRPDDRLPYLVIIIDELADLMVVAAAEVEAAIIRLAQMARAVGIHLIVATQRPSVDVITGLIKANITSRAAFSVASSIDSRTILDQMGAEKLLGRGDMLYTSAELSKPKRLQGAYVSESEVQRIVEHLREANGTVEYSDEVTEQPIVAWKDDGG
ncbi:DNA translocase FtsK 4TM domain-containing protein, partial [Candidatus Uhrbacteria bacterium]|nr:DNA translocase FtsK 4TM domain-containing protein [Candidatus Uhrbacteria bacterium]